MIHSTDLGIIARMACAPLERPPHQRLPAPDPALAAAQAAAAAAAATAAGGAMRCGGVLHGGPPAACSDVRLRVLIDGSLVEAFCAGQALATRVYRGDELLMLLRSGRGRAALTPSQSLLGPQTAADAAAAAAAAGEGGAVRLVAFGRGPAQLLTGSAWHMDDMWLSSC